MRTTIDSYRGEQFTLLGEVTRGEALATVDVAAGASVVPLDSTAGYPASGTAVVDGIKFTYTALTATSLTGCTGTPLIQSGSRVAYALDLRLAQTVLRFSARRERADASAVVEKWTSGNGVTIPGAAPGNIYNVQIASADTDDFTTTELLVWELKLTEPSGDITVIADGDWRVALGASA